MKHSDDLEGNGESLILNDVTSELALCRRHALRQFRSMPVCVRKFTQDKRVTLLRMITALANVR